MRNLYGTRSIIPNNYYFTFDKIYSDNTPPNSEDGVLIGRCVLCQKNNTVWLKTVNGYIKVAKLDNEGRFKFLEGFPLTDEYDIDDLTSLGDSPNGNGTYIVNYDKEVKGTYPSIEGIKGINENGKSNYLSGITFLLEQYSETIQIEKYQPIESDDKFSNIQTYYTKEGETYKQQAYTELDYETALNSGVVIYIKSPVQVKVYQIMTDISSGLKDKPDDNKKNRGNLYHNNKTFTRQCLYTYSIVNSFTNADGSVNANSPKKYFKYDAYENGFYEVKNPPEIANVYYTRSTKEGWSTWDDLSEQYTGYIGDLDPLLKENNEESKNDNLSKSSNLVEALNAHDKIIGANSRIHIDIDKNGTVNSISNGVLSSNLSGDFRPYKILEDNIMDALVHHDADIGDIENLQAGIQTGPENPNKITTNNLQFTKGMSHIEGNITDIGNIQSLTQAIQLLDKIIGAYRRFDDNMVYINDPTLIHNIKEDFRSTSLEGKNIIDALLYHDADIGELSRLTNINNINFTKNAIRNLDTDVSDGASEINSLVDAILVLNDLIGQGTSLGTKDLSEENPTGLEATNIIEALMEHDNEIGELENLTKNTNNIDKNSVSNLVGAINRLNDLIGLLSDITKQDYNLKNIKTFADAIIELNSLIGDKNVILKDADIKSKTIVEVLQEHDDEIGELKNLNTTTKSNLIAAINELVSEKDEIQADLGKINHYLGNEKPIEISKGNETITYETLDEFIQKEVIDAVRSSAKQNEMVNKLSENMDILDTTLAFYVDQQEKENGIDTYMNWETF